MRMMFVFLLHAIGVASGLGLCFCCVKVTYHRWARRGSTAAMVGYTVLCLIAGALTIGALALADVLQKA